MADLKVLKLEKTNARQRSDAAKSALEKSIEQFGAGRSVLMDGDGIIRAGNGTVEAAIASRLSKAATMQFHLTLQKKVANRTEASTTLAPPPLNNCQVSK